MQPITAFAKRDLEAVGFVLFDIDHQPDPVVFLGDSPNDGPMFAFFPHSFGVANVRALEAGLASPPRWITSRPGGFGFAEFADALLRAKS